MSQVETPRPQQAPESNHENDSGSSSGFMSKTREKIANLPAVAKAGIVALGAGAIFGAGKMSSESAPNNPTSIEVTDRDFDGDGEVDERVTTETFDEPVEIPVDNEFNQEPTEAESNESASMELLESQQINSMDELPENTAEFLPSGLKPRLLDMISSYRSSSAERLNEGSYDFGWRGYVVGVEKFPEGYYWTVLENPVIVTNDNGTIFWVAPGPDGELFSIRAGDRNDEGTAWKRSGEEEHNGFKTGYLGYFGHPDSEPAVTRYAPEELTDESLLVHDLVKIDFEPGADFEARSRAFIYTDAVNLAEALQEELLGEEYIIQDNIDSIYSTINGQ